MGSTLCKQEDAADVVRITTGGSSKALVREPKDEAEDDTFGGTNDSDSEATQEPRLSRPGPGGKFGAYNAQHSLDTVTKRLIVVCKELPVSITKVVSEETKTVSWDIKFHDARNFMTNLRALQQQDITVLFVGSVGDVEPQDQEDLENTLLKYNCVPVFMDPKLKKAFLFDFCKSVLWANLHYVLPHHHPGWAKDHDAAWQAYSTANLLFAGAVSRVVEDSGDTIWVHNYHLFLVPSFIRNKRPRVKIGFFVHTPWCSSDVFRVLPCAEALLRGILSCDLIGFHTFDYVRHFLSSCKRVLQLSSESRGGGRLGVKYNGRSVTILISHLGIESDYFSSRAASDEIYVAVADLKRKVNGRRIVCSMDTLDMVKGAIAKFEMWERFLELHPDYVDKVCFVGYLLPDTDARHLNFVRDAVLGRVKSIQERFGPDVIRLTEASHVSLDDAITLYRAADVGLFSAFWDGLNVLPYEFTASQDPVNPGALIVSEFMGCSRSLLGVGRVNPWDLNGTAAVLQKSLAMTARERKGYHELRSGYVMQHNCLAWATGYLRQLDEAARLVVDMSFVSVGFGSCAKLVGLKSNSMHLDDHSVLSSFKHCMRRFFFVDYDGTLTAPSDRGFNGTPENVKRALESLCADPANIVFIMSGRPRSWIYQQLGYIKELGLAAEKGAFIRWPESLRKSCVTTLKSPRATQNPEMDLLWENLSPVSGIQWKNVALEVIQEYTQHTDGSSIEDKDLAIVWHYENADPEFGLLQATELERFLAKVIDLKTVEVVLYDYNRIVEVKPRGVDKGHTALHILNRVQENMPIAKDSVFVLVFGDDISDEGMFTAVANRNKPQVEEKDEAMAELRQARRTVRSRTPSVEYKGDTNTFTCCVGMKSSAAQYYVHDHEEVIDMLSNLGQIRAKTPKEGVRALRKPSTPHAQQSSTNNWTEGVEAPGPALRVRRPSLEGDF